MAPGRRQTGAEATPEPRGDREHMDTVPPPSHSRSTRTVTRQPSAPPLPPTDAELPAGTTLGSGILPPTTAMAGPPGTLQWQEGPGQHGCSCPEPAVQQQAVEGQVAHAYVPTPRTEEAAWAASALTFLLVLLTLAILYTRLHRKFRKSQSLYWAPGDAGQEPISAIIKRRLLSAPGRRKKQQRRQQRRPLLRGASSESSDS